MLPYSAKNHLINMGNLLEASNKRVETSKYKKGHIGIVEKV